MDIDIERYLDDDDIKSIVEDELRDCVRRELRTHRDFERIVTNVAYMCVWEAVDEAVGEDAKKAIARKIPEVIDDLSQYSVFKKKGEYNREDSVGQRMLEEVVLENRQVLSDRVRAMFEGLDKGDLYWAVKNVVEDTVIDWLKGDLDG